MPLPGSWVFTYHPHEPIARARTLLRAMPPEAVAAELADVYAVERARIEALIASL